VNAPAAPKLATIAARVSGLWQGRNARRRSRPRSREVAWEQRLETLEARIQHLEASLEARIEHLEASLEALQDALYRRAVLEDKNFDELRRRTEPGQMARELSQDARRRGL
jgi:predicted RNase H-like nuclease (RuvC/YqgF family)